MMKSILTVICFMFIPHIVLAQTLEGGTWHYDKRFVEYNGEIFTTYDKSRPNATIEDDTEEKVRDKNILDYSKYTIQFLENGDYVGTNIFGSEIRGKWSETIDLFMFDGQQPVSIEWVDNDTVIHTFPIELMNDDAEFVEATSMNHMVRTYPCPPIISHNQEKVPSGEYASTKLQSNSSISENSLVHYKAEESIGLNEGFKAEKGSTFEAIIDGCEN